MFNQPTTRNQDNPSYQTCNKNSSVFFTTPPDDKYICAVCGRVLRAPIVQTLCGHRISAACLGDLFGDADSVHCPANEDGCEVLQKNQDLHPDRATEKELAKLKTYCPHRHKGCDVITTSAKIDEHERSCEFKIVTCGNPGCDKLVKASELETHEHSECDHLLVICEQCEQGLTKKELENGHSSSCKPITKKCPLVMLGCNFEGIRQEIERHLVKTHMHHIELGVKHWTEMQKQQDVFKQHLEANETQIQSVKESVRLILMENSSERINLIDNTLDQISKNIKEMKNQLSATADQRRLGELEEQVAILNDELARNNTTSERNPETSARINAMNQTITRIENVQSSQQVHISDSDLRFRLLETAAYDGKLIWKITQYTRRKQDAMDGRTMSLYSQPFYTSHHGHKMCGRVYLNGDGLGKGTHLSVFFVIMHGEYDALLTWPFRQKVTLSLLDQSGSQRHVSDSFRPDPTSSSFHRPKRDMNVASGSPLFATHAQVENGNFLREDTIFIKISVDLSDMPEV